MLVNMIQMPTIDLAGWLAAGPRQRAAMAGEIDASLRRSGMFLLRGHEVPAGLAGQMRACGRDFFALPPDRKAACAVRGKYDNGWTGPGLLAAAAIEGGGSAPDLHEAFHIGPVHRTVTRSSTRCTTRPTGGQPRSASSARSPTATPVTWCGSRSRC